MGIDAMCAGVTVAITVTITVLLAYAYVSSEYYYKKNILRKAFDQLNQGEEIQKLNPEMNWDMANMNIDGYINNKKIIMSRPTRESHNKFTNKNTLAAFLNNVVVIDIDSNEPIMIGNEPMQRRLPKTTVSAKTPHGYHYYFYNDTGSPIPSRVGLTLNNVKYPVDLLSGPNQLIFLPPTRIESACYRWINSPFTHRIEPISKHAHLLDLFAYTKELSITPETVNACVSHSIPNLLCIVWDFLIITREFKFTCRRSSFELLHSNQHELLYRTNTNSTYYLFLKHAPLKHCTAPQFINHVADLIRKHKIDGGIVHLGSGFSHKGNGNGSNSIVQFNSCRVPKHGLLRAEQTLVQTSAFTHRPVSISSAHESGLNQDDTDNDTDHNTIMNEDMFLIFMLSNQTRIPCACLLQIFKPDESNYDGKLIQYFIRNVLNATHHTTHPQVGLDTLN